MAEYELTQVAPERRVAVIIPAKNAEASVRRAVASALAEPEAAEVVLIDDGSTDATAREAAAADDCSGRLVIRSLKKSGGPAFARNLAIATTKSPWICPLDADDFFQPGRLRRLLDKAGRCEMVADDLLLVDEGQEDASPRRLIGGGLPMELKFRTFVDANVSRHGQSRREYGFLKPLMRRDFLQRAKLAYDDLRLGEDFILYAAALAKGARFRVVEPCGYVAVQRPGSLSHSHTADDLRRLLQATNRLALAIRLPIRDRLAMRRHQRHLQAKIDLRDVLAAGRAGGLMGAARVMVRRAHNAPYILSQRLRENPHIGLRERIRQQHPAAAHFVTGGGTRAHTLTGTVQPGGL